MSVFIANFGQENYEWPDCLERSTIATMNEIGGQAYWASGNREAYIQSRMKERTAAGNTPTRSVAARWYNLMTTIVESSGDIWIHREKDQLWWTISKNEPPSFEQKLEPVGRKRDVIVCHKPCNPWSNKNEKGNRLDWNSLHPKAREFLFTEGTLQKLSKDNSEYALAIIEGVDLSSWHSRHDWIDKADKAKKTRAIGTVFSAAQRSAAYMVMTALGTVSDANGQKVLRTVKDKNTDFSSKKDFESYLLDLLNLQEGLCAITGLKLQHHGDFDDAELLCSLDRIDSNGHYDPGNLQIVCKFVNRWKSDSIDDSFRRLVELVRSTG